MRARFTTGWGNSHAGYEAGTVVTLGERFTPDEIPASLGKKLLKGGTLEKVGADEKEEAAA